jgi:hypothetical protein
MIRVRRRSTFDRRGRSSLTLSRGFGSPPDGNAVVSSGAMISTQELATVGGGLGGWFANRSCSAERRLFLVTPSAR